MDDPVCEEFFMGQGQPLAERAGTTRDLLETGDPLDPVSYSELSLLQSRIDMLGEEASADQAGLLERVNAPFTEVVDAVVADNARMEEEITIPEVDVTDSVRRLADEVRKTFAACPDAQVRGYGPARFSFNAAAGGRCATTSSMPAGTGGSIVRRRWCGAIWRGRGS